MSDIKTNVLTDNDLMPFGKAYKGTKMVNIPASYLIWLYNNNLKDGNVKDYIEDIGLDTLKKEAIKDKTYNKDK